MAERLTAADLAFLYLEERRTPQHVGGIAVFERPAGGVDYDELVHLVEERITLVPRYRQRIRSVPGHLSHPVWVDDPNFDITYHLRRSALPSPGSQAQLLDYAARVLSRLLDRSRPLWEMYLVEGLAAGRVAIITKTHHSLVDGTHAVDLAELILDDAPNARTSAGRLWMPAPEPSSFRLVGDAVGSLVRRPALAVDTVRYATRDAVRGARHAMRDADYVKVGSGVPGGRLLNTGLRAVSGVMGVVHSAASTAGAMVSGPPSSPLNVHVGEQRRLAVARTSLDDYRAVRTAHGGTVNDVVLTVVTGALRGWLLLRGEPVVQTAMVRALVPLTVEASAQPDSDGPVTRVVGSLVDLPVGEPDPLVRLSWLRFAMAGKMSASSVSADALIGLSKFAPPTLHALGARTANTLTERTHNITITNSPGAQQPRYAAGARMVEVFPMLPLGEDKAISIGVTSYDGGVFYGLNADRDSMPDVGALGELIEESLTELVTLSSQTKET